MPLAFPPPPPLLAAVPVSQKPQKPAARAPGSLGRPLVPSAAPAPLPSSLFVPFLSPAELPSSEVLTETGPVETFDPVSRAQLLVDQLPRRWSGTYTPFDTGAAVPVELSIETATAMGQMVDLRGRIVVAGSESPIQGNLNAKSDQLDLLLLGDSLGGGLEAGGEFQGLQGFSLSGWRTPRLTSPGGRLQLAPQAEAAPGSPFGPAIRGLW